MEKNGQLWRFEGNFWQPASDGLLNISGDLPFIEGISGEGDIVFISAKDPVSFKPSFFLSTDGGKTWEGGWEAGLPDLLQYQAFLKNGLIHVWGNAYSFAGHSKHIWVRELDLVSIDHKVEQSNIIHIFPNPTDGLVELVFQNSSPFSGVIQVYNLQGQVLWSTTLRNENRIHLPADQWAPGAYIISVHSSSGLTTHQKLIVRKL